MVFGLVDIDHFKRINDRLGHGAGDDILRQFATVLLGLIREGDYVIRWGGEEFLIVFRPMSRAQMPRVGQRLVRTISEHSFTVNDGQRIELSCSLGLSDYPGFQGASRRLELGGGRVTGGYGCLLGQAPWSQRILHHSAEFRSGIGGIASSAGCGRAGVDGGEWSDRAQLLD